VEKGKKKIGEESYPPPQKKKKVVRPGVSTLEARSEKGTFPFSGKEEKLRERDLKVPSPFRTEKKGSNSERGPCWATLGLVLAKGPEE